MHFLHPWGRERLPFEAGGQTISLKESADIRAYGRGALQWDDVARAAAFITSTDSGVEDFARPVLVAFEAEIAALGRPGRNLLQALVLFEALKEHGVRYRADANSPFARMAAERTVVDDIQYPVEVLHKKIGDCDDLTVLYCALLESAGVPTALVDYPEHIFAMFDTGVERHHAHRLPLDESLYFVRGDRLWIPVEVTRLGQSFLEAWRRGAEELAQLSDSERRRAVVDTESAWEDFPPASPSIAGGVSAPARATFERVFTEQRAALQGMIDEYIEETYLYPLRRDPDNEGLRTQLLRMYLELQRYDTAITTATNYLLEEVGDKAATYNHLGIAHFLQGEMPQAALNFKQAMALRPDDRGLEDNLAMAFQKMGKARRTSRQQTGRTGGEGKRKGVAEEVDVDGFYWLRQ